jgi:hypothetical protein
MTGQGRPQFGPPRWLRSCADQAAARLASAALICALVVLSTVPARAAELDVRLRIAWGGGESSAWQGDIMLSEGTLSEVVPLGLEADDPGSLQLVDGLGVRIHPRTPRGYDGCDVRITAPADAKLLIEIGPEGALETTPIAVPLADVIKGIAQFPLDERQNRLLVQRSPGDAIRVALPKDHLVFSPGESLALEVSLNPADWPATTYLSPPLLVARTEQAWNSDVEPETTQRAAWPRQPRSRFRRRWEKAI